MWVVDIKYIIRLERGKIKGYFCGRGWVVIKIGRNFKISEIGKYNLIFKKMEKKGLCKLLISVFDVNLGLNF